MRRRVLVFADVMLLSGVSIFGRGSTGTQQAASGNDKAGDAMRVFENALVLDARTIKN